MEQPAIEPVSETLRVVDGARLEDAAPYAVALSPPRKAARGREDEYLLLLLNLSETASPRLYRELRGVVAGAYWSTPGSITAVSRRSVAAANRYLFEHNLNSRPSERCYGGLACAVLHGEDFFILQAGPVRSCVLHRGRLMCFPRDEQPAHLGISPVADVHLNHVFTAVGDTLLLASSALIDEAGEENLVRLLRRPGPSEVLARLEQVVSGGDFTVLVARLRQGEEIVTEEPPARETPRARPPGKRLRPYTESPEPSRPQARRQRVERRPTRGDEERGREPAPGRRAEEARAAVDILEHRRSGRKPGLSVAEWVRDGFRWLGGRLGYVGRGLGVAGGGMVAVGKWLGGAVGTLFEGVLPGRGRASRQRVKRRPPPEENRAAMMAIAVGIPVLIAIIVAFAHSRFGAASRFQGIITRAEEEIALAQALGDNPQEARSHWEAALELAGRAARLHPDAESALEIQRQAQEAIDRLDHVRRLTTVELADFGSPNLKRRLALHDRMLFVIDPTSGWVARVSLNRAGDGLTDEDIPVLVHTGQQVDGHNVGELIDAVWVDRGSGRQMSALLILEEGGALVSYDPGWQDESGSPQLRRSFLGVPPPGEAKAVATFDGRFYVLDTAADGTGQIWRYLPRDDDYPDQPELYFANPPSRALTTARDIVIDGHIYVLYADGTIVKFLGGDPQPFEIRGVPGGLGEVVAFAVDPDTGEGVYVADRGNARVVSLGPEGAFREQFRAEGAFNALEALAVDEETGQLYTLGGGRLYTASLP